jgi:hypothetical protein
MKIRVCGRDAEFAPTCVKIRGAATEGPVPELMGLGGACEETKAGLAALLPAQHYVDCGCLLVLSAAECPPLYGARACPGALQPRTSSRAKHAALR